MTSLRSLLRRGETALRTTETSPRQAATAFAVGVFLSFSPLLGLQVLLAVALGWLFKLNRVLLFIGLLSNLPWLMAPYYAAVTQAAAWAMGAAPPSQIAAALSEAFGHSVLTGTFWRGLLDVVRPLCWPFVVGSTVAAGVLSLVAFRVGLALATARRSPVQNH